MILYNVLIRFGVLTWISQSGLIWKDNVQVALPRRQSVLPRIARIESVMDLF